MNGTLILLALPASCLILLVALRFPKTFLLWGVWLVVFADTLEWLTGILQFTYLDEALIAVVCVLNPAMRLVNHRKLVVLPGTWWLVLFLVAGILGNLVDNTPLHIAALGALLAVKGFLLAFAAAQLDWSEADVRRAAIQLALIAALCALAGFLNLVFPQDWAAVFSPSGSLDHRGGVASLIGPFVHPGVFATIMGLSAIALLAYRRRVKKSRVTALLLISTSMVSVLAMRRRLWVALAGSIALLMARTSSRATSVLASIVVIPILALLGWDILAPFVDQVATEYFSESASTSAARTAMTFGAFRVAGSGVLIGAGFGRFGTWPAAYFYSPRYEEYSFQLIYGLAPLEYGGPNWLTDTFWPAVLGETGWLGTAAFICVIVSIWRMFSRLDREPENPPLVRLVGLTGIGWLGFTLFDSVAAPAFTTAYSSLLFFIVGVGAALTAKNRRSRSAGSASRLRQPTLSNPAAQD